MASYKFFTSNPRIRWMHTVQKKRSTLEWWSYSLRSITYGAEWSCSEFRPSVRLWVWKIWILTLHLNRPIRDYEDLKCPDPSKRKSDFRCYMTCHSIRICAVQPETPTLVINGYVTTLIQNHTSVAQRIIHVKHLSLPRVFNKLMTSFDLDYFSTV